MKTKFVHVDGKCLVDRQARHEKIPSLQLYQDKDYVQRVSTLPTEPPTRYTTGS